jgi:glucose/arabinose dehydrogenase
MLSLPLLGGLPGPAAAALPLTEIAAAHEFSQPLFLANAGDGRLFVVEKGGLVKLVHPDQRVTTFLNISGKVSTSGERGLLGLAFHPSYATNGLFYVDYTRPDGDIVIAEYRRSSGDPDVGDPASERIVLTIEHSSASNHNGGWLGFRGANLYISVGDGGNTPGTAQSRDSLLGKILRINPLDPDGPGGRNYSIPSSNPFVGRSGLDEIWSLGLRNPWRCSHDSGTGYLWCGDVGQSSFEEVNRHRTGSGRNFGWQLLEGLHYYNFPGRTRGALCESDCRTLPILEYRHTVSGEDNCSVTGGYVSRRSGATLFGKYVYGDLCSGRVWAVPAGYQRGDPKPLLRNTDLTISSFGVDASGRMYVLDYGGRVFRLNGS